MRTPNTASAQRKIPRTFKPANLHGFHTGADSAVIDVTFPDGNSPLTLANKRKEPGRTKILTWLGWDTAKPVNVMNVRNFTLNLNNETIMPLPQPGATETPAVPTQQLDQKTEASEPEKANVPFVQPVPVLLIPPPQDTFNSAKPYQIVVFKSGKTLTGHVVKQNDTSLTLSIQGGTVSISQDKILRIDVETEGEKREREANQEPAGKGRRHK